MPNKVWNEIIYPSQKMNGATVEVSEWNPWWDSLLVKELHELVRIKPITLKKLVIQ